MPQVQAFADLPFSAESAWQRVGSFQGIGAWHPLVASVEGEGEHPGAERIIHTADGQRQVERLAVMDPVHHAYRYTVTATAMPVRDCVGEFQVRRNDAEDSTVAWTVEFTVTSGEDTSVTRAMQRFLDAGVRSLEQRYAPGGGSVEEDSYIRGPDSYQSD